MIVLHLNKMTQQTPAPNLQWALFKFAHYFLVSDLHGHIARQCVSSALFQLGDERDPAKLTVATIEADGGLGLSEVDGWGFGTIQYWETDPDVGSLLIHANNWLAQEGSISSEWAEFDLVNALYGYDVGVQVAKKLTECTAYLKLAGIEPDQADYNDYPGTKADIIIGSMLPYRALLGGNLTPFELLERLKYSLNPGGILVVSALHPYLRCGSGCEAEQALAYHHSLLRTNLFGQFMTGLTVKIGEFAEQNDFQPPPLGNPPQLDEHEFYASMDGLEFLSASTDKHRSGRTDHVLLGLGLFQAGDCLGADEVTPEACRLVIDAYNEAAETYPPDADPRSSVSTVFSKTFVYRQTDEQY